MFILNLFSKRSLVDISDEEGGDGQFLPHLTSPEESGEDAPNEASRPRLIHQLGPAAPVPRDRPPPPSPLVLRGLRRSRGPSCAGWKKGRRSRQRYENERQLFAQFVDPEDQDEAFTLVRDSNSHFKSLLEDENLLNKFLDSSEAEASSCEPAAGRRRMRRRPSPRLDSEGEESPSSVSSVEPLDPETAYLSIGFHTRVAMKRHLPVGMVEGLEDDIRDFFSAHPDAVYVDDSLSSYERLLAHACCAYNRLTSKSLDVAGARRQLMVENPRSEFRPTDPRLSVYLRERTAAVAGGGNGRRRQE